MEQTVLLAGWGVALRLRSQNMDLFPKYSPAKKRDSSIAVRFVCVMMFSHFLKIFKIIF